MTLTSENEKTQYIPPPPAYGIDLAGYSTGRTGFARAEVASDGSIAVIVYTGHPFATKKHGHDPIEEQVAKEREAVIACCQEGKLLVDTPIDMQGLPYPKSVTYTWQLTKRPVDVAFGAMPPFAERIGAPAARFQYIMNMVGDNLWEMLGTRLYETYPAASLKRMTIQAPPKGDTHHAIVRAGQWNDDTHIGCLARMLTLVANEGASFTPDDLDAVICAVTGVADEHDVLQGDALASEIGEYIKTKLSADMQPEPPKGFVLLKRWPQTTIRITKAEYRAE